MSQGEVELPHRNQEKQKTRAVDLWTIRLRRTGALAVENAARFPPRTPLPTSSTALHLFSYIFKSRTYKGMADQVRRRGFYYDISINRGREVPVPTE